MLQQRFRSSFRLLCWEAAFAMAYETWVGATYLSGLAGELGVSVGLVTLLTMVPWIGWSGQLIGNWLIERIGDVRAYTLAVAAVARSLWLIPLATALYWTLRNRPFPMETWIVVLSCTACVVSMLGSSSASAWYSWMRAIVPPGFQGRFFGARQRYTMSGIMLANLLAASWVGWRPGGLYAGYAAIGILAICSGAASTAFLSRVPGASHLKAPGGRQPPRPMREMCLEPFRDRAFRPVLVFIAVFNGAMQMAGPFFPYYFTKELRISMSTVAIWTLLTNVAAFVAAPWWGRQIDRARDAGPLLRRATLAMSFSPILYLFPSAQVIRFIAPIDFLTNGLVWSGYTLCMTTLLMARSPRQKNVAYFSLYVATSGLAGALGTWIGGFLAAHLAGYGGFRALFVIAAVCRATTVLTLGRRIRPV